MTQPQPDDLIDAMELIVKILKCLPDNGSHPADESWKYCWEELSGDAQDEVKAVRDEVIVWVKTVQARGRAV